MKKIFKMILTKKKLNNQINKYFNSNRFQLKVTALRSFNFRFDVIQFYHQNMILAPRQKYKDRIYSFWSFLLFYNN